MGVPSYSFYPVYLLFPVKAISWETVLSKPCNKAGPQLQADDTISQPQTPSTADIEPIQRVLLLVNVLI